MQKVLIDYVIYEFGELDSDNDAEYLSLLEISEYTFIGDCHFLINGIEFSIKNIQVLDFLLSLFDASFSTLIGKDVSNMPVLIPDYSEKIYLSLVDGSLFFEVKDRELMIISAKCDFLTFYRSVFVVIQKLITEMYNINPELAKVLMIDELFFERIRKDFLTSTS